MAADPRAFIALLILLFIFLSPDPQAPALQHPSRRVSILDNELHSLSVLNSSQYGDFAPTSNRWLNVTGFRDDTANEHVWSALDAIKEHTRELSGHALGAENVARLDGVKSAGVNEDESGLEESNSGDGAGNAIIDDLALYRNITGVVHGTWIRSPLEKSLNLAAPVLNLTNYTPEGPFGAVPLRGFGRNITGSGGEMVVRFEELDSEGTSGKGKNAKGDEVEVVRMISAHFSVDDAESGSNGFEVRVHGVHFLDTGNVLMATTSDKFAGIFALPHLAVSKYQYDAAQELLNRTLTETVERQSQGMVRLYNPWTSNTDGTSDTPFTPPNCELIVYAQQHLAPESPSNPKGPPPDLLRFMEQELRLPTGAFLPPAYDMQHSLLIFSPDCGFVLESKGPPNFAPVEGNHLTGPKLEVEYALGRHHLLVYGVVLAVQLWLLTRQMSEASTPSTRSRISFYTISILALGDGFTTMSFCLISLFVPGLWVSLIATSFMAFLSVSFFGMRFLMDIWSVQAPERERRERQRRAAAAALVGPGTAVQSTNGQATADVLPTVQAPVITAAGADILPLPVTAPRPVDTGATPVPIPLLQDQNEPAAAALPSAPVPGTATPNAATTTVTNNGPASGFGALYTRFYFLLLASLFLSLNATTWPAPARRFYFTTLAFLYLSFWVPQIYRNAVRNCRRALRWDYVIGQSILRLVPFAYFYGYNANVLFADVDLVDLAVLAAWMWVQGVVLVSQEVVGPRWFVRTHWVPPAYDYHPVLRVDEEGGNLPIGFAQATADASAAATAAAAVTSTSLGAKTGESSDRARGVFDCAICMQELEVPIVGLHGNAEGGLAGGAAGLLARRAYMVTPCRHIFHSHCLEGWMKYRLQCPICREGLPPL